MEAHSLDLGDSLDETVEERTPIALTALVGVVPLAPQDGDELGPVSKKPHRSHTLSKAHPSRRGPRAVTVGE